MKSHRVSLLLTIINAGILCITIALSSHDVAIANPDKQVSNSIHAREIFLVDNNDNVRAGMMMENDHPAFFLINDNDTVVSYWRTSKDGTAFCLRDSQRKPRLYLDVDRDENPSLLVMASGNRPAAKLGWSNKNGANLVIKGREGDSAIMLGQARQGMLLGIADSRKTARLMLGTQPRGNPLLTLCDTNARPMVALAVNENVPAMMVQKKPGSRMVASTLPDGEAYVSIARDDEIVWKQPADLGIPAGPRVLPDVMLDDLLER